MWDFVPKGGDTFLFHFWKVYGGRKISLAYIEKPEAQKMKAENGEIEK